MARLCVFLGGVIIRYNGVLPPKPESDIILLCYGF
jgi:hypothetical protein